MPERRDTDLESLRNVGPASAKWLRAIGIETIAELKRVGPAEAYGRIVYRFGRAANLNLLYALATGLENRPYNDLSANEKRRLHEEAGIDPPKRT